MTTKRSPQRVLIVDDGRSGTGLAVARELAACGHVVGLACPDLTSFVASSRAVHRRHRVPAAREDVAGFHAEIARVGAEYDVALATGDAEQLALAAVEADLPLLLGQPQRDVLRRVLDKQQITDAALRVGISTPRSWPVGGAIPEVATALAVKPRLHWEPERPEVSIGPTRLLTRPQVEALGDRPDLLAQEAVAGRLGAVVLVLARNGELVAQHQQVATRVYPVGAGNCVRGRTVPPDPDRVERAVALLRSLGFWGLAQLEYVEPADGAPALIDVNPRAYGSMALAVSAGMGPVRALLSVTIGEPVPQPRTSRSGIRYSSLGLDLRRAATERRHGLPVDLASTALIAAGSVHAVWSWRDPRPALRQWRQSARRVVRRLSRAGAGGASS